LELVSVAAAKTHEKGVTSLEEYGGNMQLLATGGRDGMVRLWDVRSGHASGKGALEMQTG
jgi:WD repeat-containing protein 89